MKKKLKPGETAIWYSNPYYNEVIVFIDEEVPTSQPKYKKISDNNGKPVFESYEKSNVKEFKDRIRARLLKKRKSWWPYKGFLSITVTIAGPQNQIMKKDIDNYLKTIFDTLKGLVFDDDSQIISVLAEKEIMEVSDCFVIIGLKERSQFGKDENIPFTHSGDENAWKEERLEKIRNGELYEFDFY